MRGFLEEGAYYQRRDGRVVGPARRRPEDALLARSFPWDLGGESYTASGRYYQKKGKWAEDLIGRVEAPSQREAA